MTRVRFAPPARREFLKEIAFYDAKEPGLGARFSAAVEDATAFAAAFPLAGSRTHAHARRVFVRDFPFAVVYRPNGPGIVVFAVAHHARHADYWRSRVQDRQRLASY